MDLQTYLSNATKVQRQARLAQSDQLTLGELILKLEAIAPKYGEDESDKMVAFDFEYCFPTRFASWRGAYDELALNFETQITEKVKPLTVTEFLKMCRKTIGEVFEGYKGGEYVAGKTTPIRVANWGNSGQTAVIDVLDTGYEAILITAYRRY